jgi:EAL domain-containing protein (putative c-di-GMP-specific phosphodiesterase class I)
LPANCLELELTEGMLMEDIEQSRVDLRELKDMGVRLAVDDFGTGYSSLSYLKRFPLDTLKIDRSFIQDLPGDHDDAAITTAIIRLAKSLGLTTVAEGVETEAQRALLLAEGCDCLQGYLWGRPVPAAELEALLRQVREKARVAMA